MRVRVSVADLAKADWPAVRRIYLEGVATGDATFQTDAPEWDEWNEAHLETPRLVLRVADTVVAWAALSPVSRRPVYSGVCEVSVYTASQSRGKGYGKQLLEALILRSELAGIWTLQAAIFPENEASLRLHASCGFRLVGRRLRLGRLHGHWRDVLLLERRSAVV